MAEEGKDISTIKRVEDDFGMTINGGIGDGKNDGGPAYCVGTVPEAGNEEKY